MRTPGNILRIATEQSPLILAKEMAWRVERRWKRFRFDSQIARGSHSVLIRMVPYYRPNLSQISEKHRQIILELADGVCSGRYHFLSYGTVELGMPPDWNLDFVSGLDWPPTPSGTLQVVRLDGSDVKVPWELSRLQMLPLLGKAYCLKRDPRYRQAARDLVADWIGRNPVGHGVNWMIAMEAALRSLSILFLLNLLWPLSEAEKDWEEKVRRLLWEHLLFIEAHLEFSHIVRGNHYLSNLVGLYGISVFLEGPGMEERRRRYRRLLERAILHQVYQDGGNYEASTGYQVLVTQLFATAYLLMRADGGVPDPQFSGRLHKMFEWMVRLASVQGCLPHVGDCDDGRVEFFFDDLEQMALLPLTDRDSLRVSNLLGLGSALFGTRMPGRREDAAWYGLSAEDQTGSTNGSQHLPEKEITILPQSGIAIARRKNEEAIFCAIPNGIAGKGTHTHNDKLSLILRLDGVELLCDSGTGCYTRDRAIRDRFRATSAHNTIIIDREEQNRIPGKPIGFFSLGNEAKVGSIEYEERGGIFRMRASHYGYMRKGVIHTRLVEWPAANRLRVEDLISGEGEHSLELCYQIHPKWRITDIDRQQQSACCLFEGPRRATLVIRAPFSIAVSVECAEISRVFGTTVPAERICVRSSVHLPVSIETEIAWDN